MTNDPVHSKRGEVWLADFTSDSTATEMNKKGRPVVVLNVDALAYGLPHRIVVPLTQWKPHYCNKPWQVRIEPDATNGLDKIVAANTMQIRSIDVAKRLTCKLGSISAATMDEIASAIALVIDFYPPSASNENEVDVEG